MASINSEPKFFNDAKTKLGLFLPPSVVGELLRVR